MFFKNRGKLNCTSNKRLNCTYMNNLLLDKQHNSKVKINRPTNKLFTDTKKQDTTK